MQDPSNQSHPQTPGGHTQQGRPNLRRDAAVWLGQTTLEVVVSLLGTTCLRVHCLSCCIRRLGSKETRINGSLYTRVTNTKKRSRPKENPKKEKWGDDRQKMIWGDHWTPISPLFSLPFSFSPPWPDRDVDFISSDLSDSRDCAVFLFSLWIPASPRIFASPLFPLYQYFGPEAFCCFFPWSSLLSLLSTFYFLPFQLYWLLLNTCLPLCIVTWQLAAWSCCG